MILKSCLKTLVLFFAFVPSLSFAQDDLLSRLGEEEEETVYAKAGFKTTRVINAHSFENVAPGVMDLKISHRFGFVSDGAYELWGLDKATMRFGFDFGLTDNLMVGWGRSTVGKSYDAFAKYKFLRQSTGAKNMPLSLAYLATSAVNTLKFSDPNRNNYFTSRLSFVHQLIIGRKFSEDFSFQLMPSLVHRNLVETVEDKNDVFLIGMAGRQKINKRLAVNWEYHYNLDKRVRDQFENSLSLGLDIETGGHVFQLHFTNSTAMTEMGYLTQTNGSWAKGNIHFGFNVSRVFTMKH